MNHDEIDYFRRRERQERSAAKAAGSLAARRAHQQMLAHYGAAIRGLAAADPVPSLRVPGTL